MEHDVGGRMVAVAPRRSLFGPDYVRLAILVAVATAVHAWLLANTAVPARDSLGYARLALNLSYPAMGAKPGETRQRIDVVRDAEQPPGYPVAVWAAQKALKASPLPLAERSLLATQLVNAAAAILLVVPLYLTGRVLFGRNVGFAGALLFQVLPVPARVTSDGLSEGVYLLAVAVAVTLGVRAARRPAIGGFLLCGLATGASYLVRPEGMLVGMAVGTVIAWAGLMRYWPRDAALGRLTALAVGVALVAVPYMVLIGGFTKKPTVKYITNPLDDQPQQIWRDVRGSRAPGQVAPLFAEWWDPVRDAGKNRELWAVGAVGKEVMKALHYVLAALLVIGLIAHRRQLFAPDAGMWVLVVLGALSLALMAYLAARIGYVSERHTLLFVMIACVFSAAALEPLARAFAATPFLRCLVWPKAAPAAILLALVVFTLPSTLKPMHPHREGHKHAGKWLGEHMAEGDWLVDPFAWGEWYAGRTLYRPVHFEGQPGSTWAIVENPRKGNPHSRLPQHTHAKELAARGSLMYHWPETVPAEDASVLVYRVEHKRPAKKQ